MPRGLAGSEGRHGPVPPRLFPIFRDREELPSATDLPVRIEEALAQSQALIVVCSPASAQSRWVGQEIRRFVELHGRERLLCVVVAGEPHAGNARECFPAAVLTHARSSGEHVAVEPLAADARPQGDGRDGALLKLLAGLLGVDLDRLRQRDIQRRRQRNRLWAGAALVLIGVLSGAAWYANLRRIDAELASARATRAAAAEALARGDERTARVLAEERERDARAARDAEAEQRQHAQTQQGIAEKQRRIADEQRRAAETQRRIAEQQRDLADRRQQVALARQLAAQADRIRAEQPGELDLAALLAVEAARRLDTLETQQALLAVRRVLPARPQLIGDRVSLRGGRYSMDGRFIVGQGTRALIVHAADDSKVVWQVAEPGEVEWTFTPDGCCLLSWSRNSGWQLRTLVDGRDVMPAPKYIEALRNLRVAYRGALQFNAAGDLFAVDGTVLRVPDGTAVAPAARAADFSADGRWFAQTEGNRLTVRAHDGTAAAQFEMPNDARPTLSFDGALVLAWAHKRIEVFDVRARRRLYERRCDTDFSSVAFSPDGMRLALSCGTDVLLHDARSGTVSATLAHDRPIRSLSFDTTGRLLLTGSYDRTARVWDVATARETWRATHTGYVSEAYFAPDGRGVLTNSGGVQVWPLDLAADSVVALPRAMSALAASADGRWLAAATFEPAAELFIVDTATGAARIVDRSSLRQESLAFNVDGSLLLVADSQTLRVHTVAEPSRVLWTWRVPGQTTEAISAAQFSPDGHVLVASGGTSVRGHITLRRCTLTPGAGDGAVCSARSEPTAAFGNSRAFFSSDASEMIITPRRSDSAEMRVWPTASTSSDFLRTLPVMRVNALAALRDQIFVAHTAGRLVERVAQPGQSGIRYPHDGFVHHLALSSDGRHLAAALSDPVSPGKNRVVVWRVDDAQEIARFTRPREEGPVLFSPDGRRLIYVDGQKIHAVQWQANDAVEAVCTRLRRNLTCEEWRQWAGDEPYRPTCVALAPQCPAATAAR